MCTLGRATPLVTALMSLLNYDPVQVKSCLMHCLRLEKKRFSLQKRQTTFTIRTVEYLSRDLVTAGAVEAFKKVLDNFLKQNNNTYVDV